MGGDFRWHHFGAWKIPFDSGIRGLLFTRPFLEAAIARHVCALPNVRVLNATVDQFTFSDDGRRVTGVQLRSPENPSMLLAADLVIDASGRGSRTPQWLEANGYPRPEESTVKVNVTYASRLYRPAARCADLKALMVYDRPPGKTMGVVFPVEGNRWLVTLGGFHGTQAPTDEEGYLGYARQLPVPDVHDALIDAEPLTPISVHRFPTNLRRHYERMDSFPEGLLVIGDAVCSFNPIYGQGMTVSALEALALDSALATHSAESSLSTSFHKSVAKIVDVPWQLTTGEDFRFAETIGKRPPGTAFLHWYTGRLHEQCTRDTSLALAFYRVMHMLDAPTTLFRPAVAARVMFGRRTPAIDRAARTPDQQPQPFPVPELR
jgi:2-polyprenyl-6-methoxyphenol hydroxylase-like FAD-dependent oxidoreductase